MSADLSAVGFRLPNQDPEAIARGNAFTATADNPSAIYYNPAGITQLNGHHLSIGVYAISAGFEYTSFLGGSATADSSFQFAPQIHYVFSPEDSPFSFGLGIFAPYGLALDYGRDTPFSTLAIDGELLFATINPVVAYQFTSEFSLAMGVAANYSRISLSRSLGLAFGDSFSFEGDDFSVGMNLGVRWQPTVRWAFGLNFRSSTEMDYSGLSAVSGFSSTLTDASLEFPANLALGASFRPTPKWNLEVGIDWTDWDSVNVTVLKGTPFGEIQFPFNYKSGFMYQFGVTRNIDPGYFLSAGYIFSENSAPDQYFSPLNPDSNLHLWSLGGGHRDELGGWAFSYTVAYNGGREVTGNASSSLIGESADGTYETLNHALNFAYHFNF